MIAFYGNRAGNGKIEGNSWFFKFDYGKWTFYFNEISIFGLIFVAVDGFFRKFPGSSEFLSLKASIMDK